MTSAEESEEHRSGLTKRSAFVLLYMMTIFIPINMFMSLKVGGAPAGFLIAAILVAAEISRIFGKPFTAQEITVITVALGSLTAYAGMGMEMIFRAYWAQSSLLRVFGLYGKLPNWYFPPPESGVFKLRTFLHPAWMLPIGYSLFGILLAILGNWSIGMLNKRLYVDIENLEYPAEQVNAALVRTISEREKKLHLFYSTLLAAFLYGLLQFTLPGIGQAFGYSLNIIPIPWIDLSRYVQMFLPGAGFGIATNVGSLVVGLILPFKYVLAMFIGSVFNMVIGNALAVAFQISKFSEIYVYGMPIQQIRLWSELYLWLSPMIGVGIAIGIIPILRYPRVFVNAFKPFALWSNYLS